jgi:hypothetical protein
MELTQIQESIILDLHTILSVLGKSNNGREREIELTRVLIEKARQYQKTVLNY